MSKKKRSANRKCSALLAASAGAAVCLTGGGVLATNGMVSASNGGNSTFGVLTTGGSFSTVFNLFGNKANFGMGGFTIAPTRAFLVGNGVGSGKFAYSGAGSFPVLNVAAGVTVSALVTTGFSNYLTPTTDAYYAINFQNGGMKYGWVHVVAAINNGRQINIDLWSYNASGGSIKTLSESVTTSRLALTDGQEKLHWSNDNEDGVARYELQSQDDAGTWQAMDSDVPGSGSYSAKVDSGKACRLVVEMTDGSTKEIDF